jgi:hypothetical protein
VDFVGLLLLLLLLLLHDQENGWLLAFVTALMVGVYSEAQ